MKQFVPLVLTAFVLAGCASDRLDVKVTTATITPNIAVTKIEPPPKPKPIGWALKQPVDKATGKRANTDVVAGFTPNNLVTFQGWVLDVSEREAQWRSRLDAANKTIDTLARTPKTVATPCVKDKKGKCK